MSNIILQPRELPMIDVNAKVSPHFTWGELTTTTHRKFINENRQLSNQVKQALMALAHHLLEPIRKKFGPVIVHSAYRCPNLNKAIGGSKTSQHMLGEAVDFHVHGRKLIDVWRHIALSDLPFGQLILEGGIPGAWSWIHLSLGEPWRDPSKCRQVMVFDGSKYAIVNPETYGL